MRYGPVIASAALLMSSALPGRAAELVDETFGYRVTIPEGFTPVDVAGHETRLHSFLDRPPAADDRPTVITVDRLRGLVNPNDRLSRDSLPAQPGIRISLQEKTWQGIVLDVMCSEMEAEKEQLTAFVIQFPLADEAVQLTVGGPSARRQEVEERFNSVVDSFQNTKPLPSGQDFATGPRQAAAEPLPFPWTGVAVFGAMIFLLVAIVGKWIRGLFRKG